MSSHKLRLVAVGALLAVCALALLLLVLAKPDVLPFGDRFANLEPQVPLTPEQVAEVRGPVVRAADYELSGPYTHENLTVFLIHGPDTVTDKNYLTLQEALEQKKALVHETGSVNRLSVENLSPGEEVYLQSGDIVKGGQQDRMLEYDLPLPPASGQVTLASFCVEQGRWSQRGKESKEYFGCSSAMAPSNDIKLAAKQRKSQGEVWKSVAATQERLSRNVGESVADSLSDSSLQLSLENGKLRDSIAGYVDHLAPALDGKERVLGYAVVINGKVHAADIYASSALFRKLWPKMLAASAVEAVAELRPAEKFEPAGAEAVRHFLVEVENGKAYKQGTTDHIHVIMHETDRGYLFDTCDRRQANVVLHRSYLAK